MTKDELLDKIIITQEALIKELSDYSRYIKSLRYRNPSDFETDCIISQFDNGIYPDSIVDLKHKLNSLEYKLKYLYQD